MKMRFDRHTAMHNGQRHHGLGPPRHAARIKKISTQWGFDGLVHVETEQMQGAYEAHTHRVRALCERRGITASIYERRACQADQLAALAGLASSFFLPASSCCARRYFSNSLNSILPVLSASSSAMTSSTVFP